MNFGERVTTLRKHKKMTQQEVSYTSQIKPFPVGKQIEQNQI